MIISGSTAVERALMLMPMHLLLDTDGIVHSCGPTLRKLIGRVRYVQSALALRRVPPDTEFMPRLKEIAQQGGRVFLGIHNTRLPPLRGEVVMLPENYILLNLSFGIGIIEAISAYQLTEADFAANDLAIEIMYLHESNQAIRAELSRHSLHLEEARKEAELQSYTDTLTGLLNRRGFDLALSRVLHQWTLPIGNRQEFSLLHLDLDRFKAVNDSLGHAAGDEVLCNVASILKRETRNNDSVARIGGDEFMILLPGMTSEAEIVHIGERIISAIEQPVSIGEHQCSISASIGGVLSRHYEVISAEQIQADGDTALYDAKRNGRGHVRLHKRDIRAHKAV